MQQVQAELDSRPTNSYHTDSINVGDIRIVDFHLKVGDTLYCAYVYMPDNDIDNLEILSEPYIVGQITSYDSYALVAKEEFCPQRIFVHKMDIDGESILYYDYPNGLDSFFRHYTFDTDKNKCEERLRKYFIDEICSKLNFYGKLKNILCKEN